jgi:hypothetical protein
MVEIRIPEGFREIKLLRELWGSQKESLEWEA